jgi:hypothetical protein
MRWYDLRLQVVGLCAVACVFLAGLSYLVATAFQNEGTLESRADARGLYQE